MRANRWVISVEKNILVYETRVMGKVAKIERANEEDVVKMLVKEEKISEDEAREIVKNLLSGDLESIPLRVVELKRRVINTDK